MPLIRAGPQRSRTILRSTAQASRRISSVAAMYVQSAVDDAVLRSRP
jgi:hypothetical protein